MSIVLTLTPTSPPAGTNVQIKGSGLGKRILYRFSWTGTTGGQTARTNQRGVVVLYMLAPAMGNATLTVSRSGAIVAEKTVTVVPAPEPAPPPAPASALLSWPSYTRNTELPPWTYNAATGFDTDPVYDSGHAVYAAGKALSPHIVRWLPWKTLDDGLPLATLQSVCRQIKDWGAVLMVKGPTHGSDDPAHAHYMRGTYTDADLIAKYGAIYDAIAAEFPSGFFIEHVNEVDLAGADAAAGQLVADHWNHVLVPARKAFQLAHPDCACVWIAGSMTNFGGPRWGDTTPFMLPTNTALDAIKAAYTAASASDKPYYVPDAWSFHAYLSDFTVHPTSTLAELQPAIDYLGLAARTFQVAATQRFPACKIILSEWNTDQFHNQYLEWTARTAYAYPKMHAMALANGIWQMVQFLVNGDSRGYPSDLSEIGTPDMVNASGGLIFGGPSFAAFT